jgi:ATPase family protein associated with various cellular activities (AAA)/winged helix domain-containing protein
MIDEAQWQEQNTKHLATAVAYVRARLTARAGAEPQQPPAPVRPQPATVSEPVAEPKSSFWRRNRVAQPSVIVTATAAKPAIAATTALVPAAPTDTMVPPPALVTLSTRLGLSRFEQDILLLCASMELDTGIAGLCARAQGDASRPYPTFALALTIFDEPSWEALSPEGPLRYSRLIEITQSAGQPLTTSLLRADERIVNFLKGLNYPDDRLAPLIAPLPMPAAGATKPPSQSDAENAVLARVKQSISADTPLVVQLTGRDTPTKELIAASTADTLGLRVFRISASLLPTQAAEIEWFVRLWNRESLLLRAALYVDAPNMEADSTAGQAASLALRRMRGLMFLDARDAWALSGASTAIVETAKPSPREQQSLWAAELGGASADNPALLSAQFNLGATEIHRIAQEHVADENSDAMSGRLWSRCLDATRPRLDGLAQSLQPKASWSDIVLPPAEMALLQQIAAQVNQRGKVYEDWGFAGKMSRGLGISALFAGESGTGKTMAAEVLANSLKLNLNRVDLSSVVSKYIGETEKNLRRLFDAAEDGGVILFFDEADALFGKRSEVKDSHDRYANIEVNYLLQRMESYRGLAILATNKKTALDQAFLRRLRFIVKFPFPGVAERTAIWKSVFPKDTPAGNLDFARLAKFNLTGGNIHNIAVNAAFRAAHAGTAVDIQMVLDAAREEFRKIERPVNEADFRLQGAA